MKKTKKEEKGQKHIDIALPDYKIYIEVNGIQHAEEQKQQKSDLWRTYFAAVNEKCLTLNVFNLAINDDNDFQDTVTDIVNIALERKEHILGQTIKDLQQCDKKCVYLQNENSNN